MSTNEPPSISDEYTHSLEDDLRECIAECLAYGWDPYSIMADELRAIGWTVVEPSYE